MSTAKKVALIVSVLVFIVIIIAVIVPATIGGNGKKSTGKSAFGFNIIDFYKTAADNVKFNKYSKQVKKEGVQCTMNSNVIDTIGNSFIITTADGKVIVMDGGSAAETPYFFQYLKAVTGCEKPHIDAWFLSHPHDDHCEVFLEMMEYHSHQFELDKIYLNFAPIDFYTGSDEWADVVLHEYDRLHFLYDDKEVILHDDDVFYIGDAKFTVFYTFDSSFKDCNNSSLVFRMDLGGKSVMFTGDCGVEAGQKVVAAYSDSGLLHCDVCQMAHHGQNGVDKEFYKAVSPTICLWPTPSWVWDNRNGNLKTLEVRAWIEELGVKENYVSKDGSFVLHLD